MSNTRVYLRWITALMAVVFMMTAGASALAASFQARINSSSAKVYNVPSTSSKTYVSGGKGVKVTVTGYSGNWARISYRGNTGYTLIKNLNLVNRPKAYTSKSTAVYKSASTASKMGTLSVGQAVYVAGISGNYYRIQNESGSVTGYVKKGTLTTKSKLMAAYQKAVAAAKKASSSSSSASTSVSRPSSSTSGSSSSTSSSSSSSVTSTADKVIATAKKYIGRPYAHSDNPPSSFNCSSFVEYCMEKHGISMEGTAANQAADGRYTKISSLSSVKKGDVLCFDTDEDGKIDHTAIAMNAKGASFIEASQNAGKVQTNTMTSWYKDHFKWARRPF